VADRGARPHGRGRTGEPPAGGARDLGAVSVSPCGRALPRNSGSGGARDTGATVKELLGYGDRNDPFQIEIEIEPL